MVENKYNNFLTILIIIAVIAIISLAGYFGYSYFKNYNDNKKAAEAVDAFKEQFAQNSNITKTANASLNNEIIIPNEENNGIIDDNSGNNANDNGNSSGGINSGKGSSSNIGSNGISGKNSSVNTATTNKPASTIKYQGFTMLGTIEIPKINLKIPVLKEVSPKSLSKATCLIYGEINEVGNSVIIGHNNRNGTFFSNLKKLSNGDRIVITDYTGEVVEYQVFDKFLTEPDDTSFYRRETYGKREITLSTCTDNDDAQRTIIFAEEI